MRRNPKNSYTKKEYTVKDQKIGILNAISKLTTPSIAEPITDHMIEVGLEAVTVESLIKIKDVSKTAAEKVVAAIDIHNALDKASTRKTSEIKPSTAEKFRETNDLEGRKEIGRQVAELRINPSGSKPMSWSRIRGKLGLRNEEFHKSY